MSETLTDKVQEYWNRNIHDESIVRHPVGSREFFDDLKEYRFDKNRYLRKVVDFSGYGGKKLLEVGCGVGIDLVEFAKGGALVSGIDISERAVDLAKTNFDHHGLQADLRVMDGQHLGFDDNTFDVAYAHGVLPYTIDVAQIIQEIHRVLKPGGEAILQAYNRHSWFNLLSKVMRVELEHEDAPAFNIHTVSQIKVMSRAFENVRIIYERFPVRTRLHGGLKGALYNRFFVGSFNAIPRPMVRRFGWHIIVKAVK